jgi:hypothetical protein
MSPNYFKIGKDKFVAIHDIEEAWSRATLLSATSGERIWVFKPIMFSGPWQECPIIGHRPLSEIAKDLQETLALPDSPTKRGLILKYREEYKAANER